MVSIIYLSPVANLFLKFRLENKNILKGSHIENAWSGRDTRGHIQFNGNSMHAIETDTDYHINIMPKDDFKEYIDMLIRQ